jgi:tetratricopeptide (TPR) repeat protein
MLETIREYAHEKLVESGEYEVLRARHLDFFAGLAEHVEPELHGPRQVTCFDRLELEDQDLRMAVEWASASPDRVETGLRLAGALEWFWYVRNHWHEWRARMSVLLSLSAGLSKTAARAKTMIGAGFLAWSAGDIGEACSILEESVALSRELGPADQPILGLALTRLAYVSLDLDGKRVRSLCQESLVIGRETQNPWLVALSLCILGLQALRLHDDATAQPLLEESATVFREVGDLLDLSEVNLSLGVIQYRRGDLEQASQLFEGGQALARVVGVKRHIATALYLSGELARLQGNDRQAETRYLESITLWQEMGNRVSRAVNLLSLAYVSLHQRDVQRARALFVEALSVFKSVNEQTNISECLAGLAAVVMAEGQPARGACLFSAARALLLVTGAVLEPVDVAEHEHLTLALHTQLDGATFDAAWAEGQAMTMKQAIAYALNDDT